MSEPLVVQVWSDVVCPWCYIGKRRLETALAGFAHTADVRVVWRSFQLEPDAPAFAPGVPRPDLAEHLGRRYGAGREQGLQMIGRVTQVAAGDGLEFHQELCRGGTNTVDAHRLLHAAHESGGEDLQGRVKEALLAAYFTDGEDVADPAVLLDVAIAAGLDEQVARATLDSDRYADEVRAEQAQAHAYGANGVPFFVVGDRYGISGAQPVEVFGQVLQRAWDDAHPVTVLAGGVTGGDGETCGPDGIC